jgi:N4-gp56 family major capsid protein
MAITGNTEMAATKQELIAALVQKELKASSILISYVNDVSAFAVKGTKSISFPKLGSLTAANRASGVAGVPQTAAATVDKLDLNQTPYVSYVIDPNDEIQSTLNWEMEMAKLGASAHSRFVDEAIVTALKLHGIEVSASGNITRDLILEMREGLNKNFAPKQDRVLVVAADQETEMLKIAEFTQAYQYGGTGNISSGEIGRVFGCPVIMCDALADGEFYMFSKSGLNVGFQRAPQMSSQSDNDYGVGAMKTAIEQLFGVKGSQLNGLSVGANKSPWIFRYNDGV